MLTADFPIEGWIDDYLESEYGITIAWEQEYLDGPNMFIEFDLGDVRGDFNSVKRFLQDFDLEDE